MQNRCMRLMLDVSERCGTGGGVSSDVSCSQSQVFDELDAVAPASLSASSLNLLSESSSAALVDAGQV